MSGYNVGSNYGSAKSGYKALSAVAAGWNLVAHTLKQGSGPGVTADAIDTTGAALLIAIVTSDIGVAAPPITETGHTNTWATAASASAAGSNRATMYYAENPSVGTNHVFKALGANTFATIEVMAWSGALTSGVLDGAGTGASAVAATVQPGSKTPSQANSLVISGLVPGTPATIDSGFTILEQVQVIPGTAYGIAAAYKVQAVAAAINPTWTSDNATAIMAVFKPSS